MRKIFFILSMIFSGFGVFAQTLVAPTLVDLPTSKTATSFMVEITDPNASETAIEVEVIGGGDTTSNVVVPGATFNFLASSLVPKTAYQVRARAIGCAVVASCSDLGPWSNILSITTLVVAPVAPILKLENNCARFVGISWEMPARGDEVTNFVVTRAFDGVSFQTIGFLPGYQRNLYDLGIAPGIPATYVVYAENASGLTPSLRLTVPVKAFVGPVPPINVTSSSVNKSDTQLNIVWDNPEQDFVCGTNIRSSYYVKIKREGETEFKVYDIIHPNSSGILIKGLKPNERVEYYVFSLSDKGLFSEYRYGVDNTYGPSSKPTNFIGVAFKDAVNNSAIGLSWDHAPKDEDYFVIEVSKDGLNFMTLGQIKEGNNTFKHEPIEEGVDYTYRIKAGNYLYGESAYVVTQPINYPYSAKPNAPYGLSGVVSAAKVNLKWYDDSNREENYILERSVDNNTSFVELKKLDRNTTTYTDNTVSAGKTYFYQVKAVNTIGSSASSNIFQTKITGGSGTLGTEISIYPNPTLGFVTISNEALSTTESFEVSIFDQNNMEVFKKTFGTKNVKINLEDYKTGVYNVIIKNPKETISRKVVKY
jgi:hypothetical protein